MWEIGFVADLAAIRKAGVPHSWLFIGASAN
jgi:hypothetical protein